MDIVVEGRWMSAPAAAWLGCLIDVVVQGTLIAWFNPVVRRNHAIARDMRVTNPYACASVVPKRERGLIRAPR